VIIMQISCDAKEKMEKKINPFRSSLKDYLYSYFQFMQGLGYKYGTNLSLLKNFDRFLVREGINSLCEINRAFILSWINHHSYLSPFTKTLLLSQVRSFFKYLQRVEVITFNPAQGIIPPKVKKYSPYIYTVEQILRILGEARNMHRNHPYENLTHYTIIYLLYALGLRISEALNIRLKDINLEERTIFIYKGKFGKERLIPFSEKVKQKLEEFLMRRGKKYPPQSQEEPLFMSRYRKAYSKLTIEAHFRALTCNLGLRVKGKNPPRLHDFRHSFAVHRLYKWYQEEKDVLNKLPLLSIYMGHVDIESTQVYLTISNALLKEANKRFQEKFGDIKLGKIKR